MFGIGMTELLVILGVALLVVGPKRLPELARSLGRAMGEFRRASTDLRHQLQEAADDVRREPEPEKESGEPPETTGVATAGEPGPAPPPGSGRG